MDRTTFLRLIYVGGAGLLVGSTILGSCAKKTKATQSSEKADYEDVGHAVSPAQPLGNFLILDLNGKPHEYDQPGNPICTKSPQTSCTSGIRNYIFEETDGRPAVILVSAYWCSPCEVDIKLLKEMHDKYKGKFQLIGLHAVEEESDLEHSCKETRKKIDSLGFGKFPNFMLYGLDSNTSRLLGKDIVLPVELVVDVNKSDRTANIVYHAGRLYYEERRKGLERQIERLIH